MRYIIPAVLTAMAVPVSAVYALDNTVIGYGQGTATDSMNRPLDALQFNESTAILMPLPYLRTKKELS